MTGLSLQNHGSYSRGPSEQNSNSPYNLNCSQNWYNSHNMSNYNNPYHNHSLCKKISSPHTSPCSNQTSASPGTTSWDKQIDQPDQPDQPDQLAVQKLKKLWKLHAKLLTINRVTKPTDARKVTRASDLKIGQLVFVKYHQKGTSDAMYTFDHRFQV